MTLYRQLLFFALLLLATTFSGLFAGNLKNTQNFLSSQLESHAQDTATSLGLSLTTHMKDLDLPAMEAMINAVFDRGYYRTIELQDVAGTVLISKTAGTLPESVPSWFARLIPLATPEASALIMKGWQQIGSISIQSHPGFAYQALWKTALSTALWFALAGLLVAILGGIGLRHLLRPLKRVEEQAQALCDRQFPLQQTIPRTRELGKVVHAMNRLATRMKGFFEEQAAIAESLRLRTYQDEVTTLGNRRYLEAQVKAQLTLKAAPVHGAFLLIQLNDLHAVNLRGGYESGDQLLKEVALTVQQACSSLHAAAPARLGGGDFALFLPQSGQGTAARLLETILNDLQRQAEPLLPGRAPIAWGGGVEYDRHLPFDHLLTEADSALAAARSRQNGLPVLRPAHAAEGEPPRGGMAWKQLLETTMAYGAISLWRQPTYSHRNREEIVHEEILARIIDPSGAALSVGKFIPTAERLGLMPALDRLILEHVLAYANSTTTTPRLAVNLSPLSVSDPSFCDWLIDALARLPAGSAKLNFEFPEFLAVRHLPALRAFADRIKTMGHAIGIDHFGQGLMHFGYLKSLLPHYVKIDRAITGELVDAQSDSFFYISSLCSVAHSLDIWVMAEGVETADQDRLLGNLRLDAIQGFYYQRPEPVPQRP